MGSTQSSTCFQEWSQQRKKITCTPKSVIKPMEEKNIQFMKTKIKKKQFVGENLNRQNTYFITKIGKEK